jgi:hypothetical protein
MPSSRLPQDKSRWVVPGRSEPLGKGQFLLAIYEDYIAGKLTLAKIQQVFQELADQPSRIGNRATYKLREEIRDTKRFHELVIHTADRRLIRVSTQWSFENFPYVLKAVHQHFQIPLQGCQLTDKMRNELRAANVSFQEING